MKVDVIPIRDFDKTINGLLKIDVSRLSIPVDFTNQTMVYIPPMQFGGNHTHPRREIFISLSDDLEIHWIDGNGIKHAHKMKEANQLYLFDVHPFIPHVIVNVSKYSAALLLEFSNEYQYDVKPYPVV